MENQEENRSSKGSLVFFIVLFILSLALNAFLFLRYVRNGIVLEKQNHELTVLLEDNKLHTDSLQAELDRTIAELQDKLNENLAMSDISDDYRNQLEEKIVELQKAKQKIAGLIAQGGSTESGGPNYGTLSSAKKEIEELKTKNTELISELEETNRLYAIARDAVDQYSMSTHEYKEKLDSMVKAYRTLDNGLAEAKILSITELNVQPERMKSDELIPTYKASKIQHLKISFTIKASSIVPKEEKVLKIRVIGTGGEVLSDNVNQLTNSNELYSLKEEIDYVGEKQEMVIYFKQKAKFKSGTHKVEFWLGDNILDTKQFELY